MLFDTKSPNYGVVEVDNIVRKYNRTVGEKDLCTDHAVTYSLFDNGHLVVSRVVDIVDRSPEAYERGIAELRRVCANATYAKPVADG